MLSPFMRRVTIGGGLLTVVAAGASIFYGFEAKRDADEQARRQAERAARAEEAAKALFDDSRPLVPNELGELGLGLLRTDVTRIRPQTVLSSTATDNANYWYEETLPNGGRVLLAFDRRDDRLAQIQVMSALPSVDALASHFRAMEGRYGQPDGVWECRSGDGITTQRMVWRKNHASLSDIVLGAGATVSVTMYIASTEETVRSLERNACRPMAAGVPSVPIAS